MKAPPPRGEGESPTQRRRERKRHHPQEEEESSTTHKGEGQSITTKRRKRPQHHPGGGEDHPKQHRPQEYKRKGTPPKTWRRHHRSSQQKTSKICDLEFAHFSLLLHILKILIFQHGAATNAIITVRMNIRIMIIITSVVKTCRCD